MDKINEMINEILNKTYPIGAIYLSTNNINPSLSFGGYWEQIKDTFLLGAGDTYTNGSTGGEASHTLTESEIPSHRHQEHQWNLIVSAGGNSGVYNSISGNTHTTRREDRDSSSRWVANTGGGAAHNNMPPYLAVYTWKKMAHHYYQNDGTTLDELDIKSGVTCTNENGWIKITTSTSGEKYVYPPVCFTGSDNWEMSFQCKTSSYSNQAFGVQMENFGTTTYSGDGQYIFYSGTTLNNCMGYGNKTGVSLSDNDVVTIRRLDGNWIILINGVEKCRKSYTWTNQRVPGFYTNSGRIQRIKNLIIKKI